MSPTILTDKLEATRLADALTKPRDWLPYYGVPWHPQAHVVDEAVALLRRWPDGEPVAWMSPGKERLEFSRPDTVYGTHTIPLYTAPPAQAERIAALEAELKRKQEEFDEMKRGYDILALAEEQQQKPGPFGGQGTPNAAVGEVQR